MIEGKVTILFENLSVIKSLFGRRYIKDTKDSFWKVMKDNELIFEYINGV